MTSKDVAEMQRRMRQLEVENESLKRLHSVGAPMSKPSAYPRSTSTDLYGGGSVLTSPARAPYMPKRGSGTDLFQSAMTAAPLSNGPLPASSSQSDLVAMAAAASHKSRQLRSRPGSGQMPFPANGIPPSHSWTTLDQLDQQRRFTEEPANTIRMPPPSATSQPPSSAASYPGNFDDVEEDDSSSIGLDLDDPNDHMDREQIIQSHSQGFDNDDEDDDDDASNTSLSVDDVPGFAFQPPVRANLAALRQDDDHFRTHSEHDTKPRGLFPAPVVAQGGGQFNSAPTPATSSRQYKNHKSHHHHHHHGANAATSPRGPSDDDSPPLPAKHRRHHAEKPPKASIEGASKFAFPTSGTRQEGDISIWVGTWNLGAADPFADSNGLMDEAQSSRMVRHFVPHGYDLYVLGVQEGVSENVYHAVLSYLNTNPSRGRYCRKELRNDKFAYPLKTSPADAVFDAVRGRGDGAFMGTKFTGLALFYAETVAADVQLLRAGVHKFSIASGSKGGVAIALKLKYTTLVFVNCHLDARNDTYRREQIRILNTQLGKVMGHPSFDLTEQFHHVVWMGDLNYRIVNMDASDVLRLLSANKIDELHERGDGLLNDRKHGIFEGFIEPRKFPDFFPTYKKFPLRGAVDMTMPDWPERVYRTLYKEPFYKGGQVKKRVPGWCDRILVYSTPIRNSYLAAEKVESPFAPAKLIDNYKSINDGIGMDISDHSPVSCTFLLKFVRPPIVQSTTGHTKRALVTAKDVFGEAYVDLRANVRQQGPSYGLHAGGPITTVLTIFNMVVMWNNHLHVPKKTRIVAPLLGEDDSGKQTEAIGERTATVTNMANLSLNVKLQHERGLQDLHMLVWVRHENVVGHCVVSLRRVANLGNDGELPEARYKANLTNNAMPVLLEGFPVKIVFAVRSNVFTSRGI
ncbi:hypothetical protein SDRG_11965 [Saprolegnia diclina VS20]|uniref:Inositol polyphosphate-related phosphatase domain-containing protein n=1 Tax=Saprolegnia diclina (strain VS20) TaxID=1156394 RepID=T0PXW9_SAPDV|nr:hypothetical protein SDRG_11965 [Saprolegnia diclina VS20]EQC30389.1 hypothetical protein SDRG_11965 [Saprolegnia diclina VS20]|eukprot:XP_008616242.1 hypothetical protein SDRG_11965 [Saprolegnia diclina VS20]